MKKLILVFAAIVIAAGVFAQADSTKRKMSPPDMNNTQNKILQNNPVDKSHADGVMMQNGKMKMVKNGQTTSIDQDLILSNGTKIMSDGTCVTKEGTKMTMKEGQHMDMSGNLTSMKIHKENNMYLVPDSTKKKDIK